MTRSKQKPARKTDAGRGMKRERVASGLRKAILSGKLRAGQRIQQEELAAQYNVSRMPVREALMALHAEGIITFHPHKGAVVTTLSAEDVQEVLEARSVLEGMVARYAVDNITSEDLEKLRELVEQISPVLDNPSEYFRLNLEFHNRIKKISRKKRLVEITNNLRSSTEHYMRIATTFSELRQRGQPQHYELLDALKNRDKDRVERLMRQHVLVGAEVLAPYFQQLSLP